MIIYLNKKNIDLYFLIQFFYDNIQLNLINVNLFIFINMLLFYILINYYKIKVYKFNKRYITKNYITQYKLGNNLHLFEYTKQ